MVWPVDQLGPMGTSTYYVATYYESAAGATQLTFVAPYDQTKVSIYLPTSQASLSITWQSVSFNVISYN